MAKKDALTPPDWIKAGFRALSLGGPQAINVEAIARDLAVSKGSFYWHFKDITAYRAAMLAHWVQVATDDIIAQIQDEASPPRQQLETLAHIATGSRAEPYGGRLAEAAIRDWARLDKNAAAALRAVDAKRLGFLKALFGACGFNPAQSAAHANLFYATLIGLEQLPRQTGPSRRNTLIGLVDLLLDTHDIGE